MYECNTTYDHARVLAGHIYERANSAGNRQELTILAKIHVSGIENGLCYG